MSSGRTRTEPTIARHTRARHLRSLTAAATLLVVAGPLAGPLAGCGDPEAPSEMNGGPVLEETEVSLLRAADQQQRGAPGIDGWWQTDGYGFAMEIRGEDLRLWQVTAVSCLPSYTGRRSEAQPRGKVAFLLDVGIRLTIAPGTNPNRKRMRTEGSVTDWHLDRIARLPAACAQPIADDPLHVYDVFWTTYAENYPFSDDKGVDWNEVRARTRPLVGPDTTPQALFEILASMTRPLHDMHTHVFTSEGTYDGWRPDTPPYTEALAERVARIVERRDVGAPLQTWAGGRVSFADLAGRIGYLRITAFDFGTEDADADAVEMDRILDEIFTPARIKRQLGLIIDVRMSTGGHNPLGLQVAARLTRRPYLAYATVARRPRQDRYTPPELSWVQPGDQPSYTGPVVLLTSPYTVSAHEVFTQALLGRHPAVIRMGGNTQGAISDHHFRSLPNGWVFTLPNQRFFSGGAAYDGAGVPPTIRIPTMLPSEIDRGEDAAFDQAVALLTRRPSRGQ